MRITIIMAVFALLLSARSDGGAGQQVTVEGEVVCLTCYLKDGLKATGSDHIGCAMACYGQGLPQAILEKESGILFLPITTERSKRGTDEETFVCSLIEHTPVREALVPYFGKTVTVSGRAFPGNGVKLLSIETVAEKQ